MEIRLKIGDRVIYTNKLYTSTGLHNPYWFSDYGCVGTITNIGSHSTAVNVEWDNGKRNSYKIEALSKVLQFAGGIPVHWVELNSCNKVEVAPKLKLSEGRMKGVFNL